MLKTLLLTTALLFPIAAFAQEATPNIPGCQLMTEKLNDMLVKGFDIETAFDTPLGPDRSAGFMRSTIFIEKTPSQGSRTVLVLETMYKDAKPVLQCVAASGEMTDDGLKEVKDKWEEYKAKGGKPILIQPKGETEKKDLTPPPAAGTVPAPKFESNNPDE